MTVYKYSLQEDYFEEIDSEEKAYWLGYILADGHVMTRQNKKSRHYGLRITSIDLEMLEKLKTSLNYTGPIFYTKGGGFENSKGCYGLAINRVKLSQDLLKYKPHKKDFGMPDIKPDYIRHLIRGYFDGDGSVYSWIGNETNRNYYPKLYYYKRFSLEASIIAAPLMTEALQRELLANNIKPRLKQSKTIDMKYVVVSGKENLHRFRYYLYNNSSIFLQRKFDKWHDTPPEWETFRGKPGICGKPVIQT